MLKWNCPAIFVDTSDNECIYELCGWGSVWDTSGWGVMALNIELEKSKWTSELGKKKPNQTTARNQFVRWAFFDWKFFFFLFKEKNFYSNKHFYIYTTWAKDYETIFSIQNGKIKKNPIRKTDNWQMNGEFYKKRKPVRFSVTIFFIFISFDFGSNILYWPTLRFDFFLLSSFQTV